MPSAKDIFLHALELATPDERRELVAKECAGDQGLRQVVEALLAAHDDPDSYLERPAARFDVSATVDGPGSGSGLSDSSSHHGRFLPGTKLAGRYRIVSLLGRGGMGEVYRADDLRLGQTVALKFLPPELAKDPKRLEYFHNEVRLARKISHPNVCRVFDIGDVDGHQFISMEYIDGEDLKALLQRIGRLQHEKGVEITQQLCAGLGAAHSRGVLHRDLKPANIMLDGQGRVRIMDFGLATGGGDVANTVGISGTPAYMAPEQLLRGETSVQSDLYSTGLILFEVFTGTSPRKASSLDELRRMHEETSSPSDPSDVVDVDPAVAEAIRRCLQPDPLDRPRSTSELANRLPGGDPLAVALEAGETPSPELVAASGDMGGLLTSTAVAYLAAIVAMLLSLLVIVPRTSHVQAIGAGDYSPDVLRHRAREILKHLDVESRMHSSHGFHNVSRELSFVNRMAKDDGSRKRSVLLRSGPIYGLEFWYRESPEFMFVDELWRGIEHSWNRATWNRPEWTTPGMVGIELTPFGQLRKFRRVPSDGIATHVDEAAPKWNEWFPESLTGIDLKQLTAADWRGRPPDAFDQYMAWEGDWPGTNIPLRVQAASFGGRPVFFAVVPPTNNSGRNYASDVFGLWFILIVNGLAALLAFYHYRLGRGDRHGAFRLAIYAAVVCFVTNLLLATHLPMLFDYGVVACAIARGAYVATISWIHYLAVEPLVRRYWPDMLISWTRLLRGQFRDPRVGHDVLAGLAMGLFGAVVFRIVDWQFGSIRLDSDAVLSGMTGALGFVAEQHLVSTFHIGFATLVVLAGSASILRSRILAAVVVSVLLSIQLWLDKQGELVPVAVYNGMLPIFLCFFLARGFLAVVAAFFAANLICGVITPDLDAFYAPSGLIIVGTLAGLAVFCFRTSQRKRIHNRHVSQAV